MTFHGKIVDEKTGQPMKDADVQIFAEASDEHLLWWNCQTDEEGVVGDCELLENETDATCRTEDLQSIEIQADQFGYVAKSEVYEFDALPTIAIDESIRVRIPTLALRRRALTVSCPDVKEDAMVEWSQSREDFEQDTLPDAEAGSIDGGKLRSAVEQFFNTVASGDPAGALDYCLGDPADPVWPSLEYLRQLSESMVCFRVRVAADTSDRVAVWTMVVTRPGQPVFYDVLEDIVFGWWTETEEGWRLDCGADT